MASRRMERLDQELRDEVALIVRGLKDPRVQWVSITRSNITSDLSYAKVYVSVLGDAAAQKKALQGLRSAAGFIRRELGQRLRMRHTPELQFEYDKGMDAAGRVNQLLDEVKAQEKAALPPDEDTDSGEE